MSDFILNYCGKKACGDIMVNTSYSDLEDLLPGFFSAQSTDGLQIPFAVDCENNIINLMLYNHALVSGGSGAGKSSLLRSVITNIIRCYHPDDVELWLVDYGAGAFDDYVRFAPPHIKFVGLENSVEFTKGFIDKVVELGEERLKMHFSEGVKNISGYKNAKGAKSLPRTVICIDEAHILLQHIENDLEYRAKLEKILCQYRSVGIHVIMSGQTSGGFSLVAKNQFGVRLAMKNAGEEVAATIEVDNGVIPLDDFGSIAESLSVGEVIYKWVENSGAADAIIHIDRVKAMHCDAECEAVCNQAKSLV